MNNSLVLQLIASLLSIVLVSCAQPKRQDQYEVPNDREGYAVVDDDVRSPSLTKQEEFVRIRSVDRLKLPYPRDGVPEYLSEEVSDLPSIDLKNAIIVTPGEHKLLIFACQVTTPNLLMEDLMCASGVVRLNAEDGGRYRVRCKVSKKKDYADIWIQDLRTGLNIESPVRISGLEREDGWNVL